MWKTNITQTADGFTFLFCYWGPLKVISFDGSGTKVILNLGAVKR